MEKLGWKADPQQGAAHVDIIEPSVQCDDVLEQEIPSLGRRSHNEAKSPAFNRLQ
jgi:hypothetical protein